MTKLKKATFQHNKIAFKHIEEELLSFGTEYNSIAQEMIDFRPESMRMTILGYSRRIDWLHKIGKELKELQNKVNSEVRKIIDLLYIENKSMEYVSEETGLSINRLNKLHKLIVTAVMERLGMIGDEKEIGETSRYIPADVKSEVLIRDEGKCVKCSSSENLHFHHIEHYAKGGHNTKDNLILLCAICHAEEHEGERVYQMMKVIAGG